ncbi:MAG: alpha/beta hydrolase [Burkholderiales bacterium]|nr:alpha/beta hydrolase [Burkholderiales bacterium]
MTPATFVLVHGAWHGGWCWDTVAALLRAQGQTCFAPTLRGLAHRGAALTPALDADDHVDDVAGLVEALDLQRVVLVLHSYAGLLGPALQARLGTRIVQRCLIEAVLPAPGQRLLDLVPATAAQRYALAAQQHGEGWRLPPPDPAQFQLGPAISAAEVARRLTPHPWRSFTTPVRAAQVDLLAHAGSYVLSSDRDPQPYAGFAAAAETAGWPVTRMPGGHLLMLTQPAALADHLLTLAHPT